MRTAPTQAAVTRFLELTAADLMSVPVRSIRQEMPLREAARLLHRADISGAPVVDGEGRCIGVLSSSDFVTRAGAPDAAPIEAASFIAPWGELINIEESADNEVRRYMTAEPVTVAPTDPIGELAQTMVDFHIHRVIVAGEDNRPRGIVTSTDILAAVGRAARGASTG